MKEPNSIEFVLMNLLENGYSISKSKYDLSCFQASRSHNGKKDKLIIFPDWKGTKEVFIGRVDVFGVESNWLFFPMESEVFIVR